jgi:formamidopyrimidine-DNA glycosylase
MPELPEVEVAARNLRRWMAGRRVRALRADSHGKRIFRPDGSGSLQSLAGARFEQIERIGKNLLITFAARTGKVGREGRTGRIGVWSHLGMTGKWLRRTPRQAAPPATRVELELYDGTRLHYVDQRMFGRLRLVPDAQFDRLPEIASLGPDPFTEGIDARVLHDGLARLKTPIKVAMLDQALLPGVGNIQASEALFRAAIDPRRPARSLSETEVERLATAIMTSIRFTLKTFAAAGADGGEADIGYVEEGNAPNPFLVYGRAGDRCPRCKTGTIVRIVQAQRATFFCPHHQK